MNPVTLPVAWAASVPAASSMPDGRAEGTVAFGGAGAQTWSLQGRCSLTPRQFGLCFLGLAGVSCAVALLFWMLGAPFVALFTGIEVLALSVGFGWHALHAADGELLSLQGPCLQVDHRSGLRHWQSTLDRSGLRVAELADGSIELRSRGRRLRVGARLDAARRRQLVAELRQLALN